MLLARVAMAGCLIVMAAMARAAPLPTADREAPAAYVTQKGDTLIGLAQRGLVKPQDWATLARINHISRPRQLPVGRALVIPAVLLRREPLTARITAFSGQVRIDPGGAAQVGASVAEGDIIGTGANSFVTLTLIDGSRITLPSQSRVRIEALQRIVLDGRLERRFRIEAGRADFGVTPRERPTDRFLVKTPVAVAAVRGTEFRVAHDATTAKSAVSVIEGEVAGRSLARRDETAVAAGSGAVLGAAPTRMAALLLPPMLDRPGRVQDDPVVALRIAGEGARRRVQLARDAGFVDLFAETETAGDEARFDNVANGTLYVRLTAIDADGVEGLPASYAIERFQTGLEAAAGALPGKPRRTQFRWQAIGAGTISYDFVLARDEALADRVVDAVGLADPEMTITSLQPGDWFWRVTMTVRDGGRSFTRALPVRKLTIAKPER